MSRSKAQKIRMQRIKEGKNDPVIRRGSWNGIRPVSRKTPSLVEKHRKLEKKHKRKWNPSTEYRSDSIFYAG